MKIMTIEDYAIKWDEPHYVDTGKYVITIRGNKKPITKLVSYVATVGAGIIPREQWRAAVTAFPVDQELLAKVRQIVKERHVWLRTEQEREDYVWKVIAGRNYLAWPEFGGHEYECEE